MGVYDNAIASAKRMIAAKGEACVWAEQSAGTVADPDEPWKVVAAPAVTHNVSIVFFPMQRQYNELMRLLKGTEVVGGALYGLMPAVSFNPDKTGIVTRKDGTKLAIVSIDPLAPNGDVILYTVEFKL